MATIQEQARQVLKAAGWRMESKLGRGKEKWSKSGIAKKVYLGTHGSIRIGENLAQSYCQVGVNKLAAKLASMEQPSSQYIAGKFCYDRVFKSWTQIIVAKGGYVSEMILVPGVGNWSESGECFKHYEKMPPSETLHDKLPTEVLHSMYDNLGISETDELLAQAKSLVA